MELINAIFEACIVPLLAVLTAYLIKWINAKNDEIKANMEDKTLHKYMDMLTDTISNCVIATNQTYVNSLKAQGAFDAAAQKKALELTTSAILNILSNDAILYLNAAVGDLDAYITQRIEAEVNLQKAE